jgi:hypothetical protein
LLFSGSLRLTSDMNGMKARERLSPCDLLVWQR